MKENFDQLIERLENERRHGMEDGEETEDTADFT